MKISEQAEDGAMLWLGWKIFPTGTYVQVVTLHREVKGCLKSGAWPGWQKLGTSASSLTVIIQLHLWS